MNSLQCAHGNLSMDYFDSEKKTGKFLNFGEHLFFCDFWADLWMLSHIENICKM